MSSSAIRQLRAIGLIEGASYLLLLGVAMPLKYLAGMPRAVSVVGMIHGVLFLLYLLAIAHTHLTVRWPLSRSALALVASLLPFGTIALDGRLRREQQRAAEDEAQAAPAAKPVATTAASAPASAPSASAAGPRSGP